MIAFMFMATFGSLFYFLCLYFQDVWGYDALEAGLGFLLPTAVVVAGSSRRAARCHSRRDQNGGVRHRRRDCGYPPARAQPPYRSRHPSHGAHPKVISGFTGQNGDSHGEDRAMSKFANGVERLESRE